MGFILDVETENAPEFTTVADGTEVELRVAKAEMKKAKTSGASMLALRFDIPAEPYTKDINLSIMLPEGTDDEKTSAQKKNRLKDFKRAFGLPPAGPLTEDDIEGAKGWAILGEEDSAEYGKQNRIKRFIAAR